MPTLRLLVSIPLHGGSQIVVVARSPGLGDDLGFVITVGEFYAMAAGGQIIFT